MATKAVSEALEHLREISSQIEVAVIFDDAGKVVGTSGATEDRAGRVAKASLELLREAEQLGSSGKKVAQLDASTQGGSLFVVSLPIGLDGVATPGRREGERRPA